MSNTPAHTIDLKARITALFGDLNATPPTPSRIMRLQEEVTALLDELEKIGKENLEVPGDLLADLEAPQRTMVLAFILTGSIIVSGMSGLSEGE